MGKFAWLVVIVLIVVVVLRFPQVLDPQFYGGIFGGGNTDTEPVVVVDARLIETGTWTGAGSSRTYNGNLAYMVYNVGTANASDVHLVLTLDDTVLEDFTVNSLNVGAYFRGESAVSVHGNEVKQATLTATCEDSADNATILLRANLERASFNSQTGRLFVTPDDPMVLATLANITTNDLIPDWVEIRDWVSKNIEYTLDSEVYGTEEYWQYPSETLTLRTGDCEDFSILLCSLLRANGWDENEAFVVIGVKDSQYHGWVRLNVDLVGWQSIEPQADALNTLVGDTLTLSGFKAEYLFNDQNFQTT
ncbi:MAG: transglutaminase domain-containing protein [Candidatus Bathyarchaeia archaeon]